MLLKSTPFGIKSCKEYFDLLISTKYQNLYNSQNITDYYDFILCAGGLRDWIRQEFSYDPQKMKQVFYNSEEFSIFHSIYNNMKHYKFKGDPTIITRFAVFDGKPISSKFDTDGNSIWNDDDNWDDNAIWVDNVIGEQATLSYIVVTTNNGEDKKIYWLYEICKFAYNHYKTILGI
jgi:hypothetical protein